MHRSRISVCALLGVAIIISLAPASAFGISRSAVLARGRVWVDKNVPYSQTRYALPDGNLVPTSTPLASATAQGYRTDCSGFVSMCLKLTTWRGAPRSLTTDTLPFVLTPTSRNMLQPGDVILRPKGPSVAYGHAVLFVAWADAAHRSYWSYEESGSNRGAVTRKVTYPFFSASGFAPYRYKGVDDYFTDCETAIGDSTQYKTATAAASITFPATGSVTPKALVVTNGELWSGNLAGVALAGASKGPLLLTSTTALPATTAAIIKRLKPARVYVIGGGSSVSTAVVTAIAKLGPAVTRISGRDRFHVAANAARRAVQLGRAAGRKCSTAYLVGAESFGNGLAVSSIAARLARPVLLTQCSTIPTATLGALAATGIKKVIIIGDTRSVGSKVVRTLRNRGITVRRIAGATSSETALLVAHHGIALRAGLSWSGLGVGSSTNQRGLLGCAVAQGESGSLLLLTPARSLDASTAAEITEQMSRIGKVRVFGDRFAVEHLTRLAIAERMRATP